MLAVKLALWVLFALAIVAVGYSGVALVVATWLSTPSRQPEERTPGDVGLNYREVSLRSTDGLVLAGWWVPGNDLSQAVVLVPGLGGDKSDRHVLETAPVYARAGYGVLMIDLRAQGRSEGERVTMGYREVRDVRAALAWLKERGFAPQDVVLHGFSMGGATVLRAAPGTSVAAVVVDSAYADLPLILRQRLPEASGLPPFFTPGVMLAARLFLNLDPWAVQPDEDTRRFCKEGVRLLIIHSTGDKVVRFGHASRLKEACPRATFWKVEGYEHVGAFTHPEYEQKLRSFLKTGASA
jgi:pimeloyl-ACP methyl ester carboxylesterase